METDLLELPQMAALLSGSCLRLSQMMFRELIFRTVFGLLLIQIVCSGHLLLCVPPATDADALHSVKWHPKLPDTLAIASQTNIYLIDLIDAAHTSRGQPLPQSDLHHISQIFSVRSVSRVPSDVLHHFLIVH
jgi:hypothetical protein